jgi:hypothetical protein
MLPQFDPSKMDPKVLMQLSQLIQQLPTDQLNKMQSLMHNAMAGMDVRNEMAEFERNLPAGFREKLMGLIASNPNAFAQAGGGMPIQPMSQTMPHSQAVAPEQEFTAADMGMQDARMTVLRGVAAGQVSPEEAEKLLFGS